MQAITDISMVDPLDQPITTVGDFYTTTAKVKNMAGYKDQDDIKDRYVNDAVKAVTAFINNAGQRNGINYSPVPADLEMAATMIAASWLIMRMQDEDKDYTDMLNMGMMILAKFLGTSPEALMQLWGFMYLSTANTRPANINADPFITINQPW